MRNAMGMAESVKRRKRNLVEQTAMAALALSFSLPVTDEREMMGLWVKSLRKFQMQKRGLWDGIFV